MEEEEESKLTVFFCISPRNGDSRGRRTKASRDVESSDSDSERNRSRSRSRSWHASETRLRVTVANIIVLRMERKKIQIFSV